MEANTPSNPDPNQEQVEVACRVLTSLFEPDDHILLRPIETWTENQRKKCHVDYAYTRYCLAQPDRLRAALRLQWERAERKHLNLFFGTCPRHGPKGEFDLAWQIRTVRVLWADLDHVSVEAGLEQVARSGLPDPSYVVHSGNGIHLYWRLDQPYLIDDAGDPPAVKNEWVQNKNGKKKPRKYVEQDGERLYLDQHKYLSRLSSKAQHLQDVLAGIAHAVGGDHTTDLSRLLRVPGSLNRKEQRNGREPVPTSVVIDEPSRRYSLACFASLATPSEATQRDQAIAVMPLPRSRKLSPTKGDRLAELIATCAIAPAGHRSEVDFALCCFAVENGADQEDLWSRVSTIGKFAEQGRRYFDVTWGNATYQVRTRLYDKLSHTMAKPAHGTAGSVRPARQAQQDHIQQPADENGVCIPLDEPPDDEPPDQEPPEDDDTPVIRIDAVNTPVRETMRAITDRLLEVGECYNRANQVVTIRGETITPILSAAELSGLLNSHAEVVIVDEDGEQFKPLPTSYANTWLNHPGERARLPKVTLYTHNPVYALDWRLVASGYDRETGIFYAGPAIAPQEGTAHLDTLLRDFCFKTPGDRTNYMGMLLTSVLSPHFVGSKPAIIFNGNQPELGKSILAQILAILRDGLPASTASYNPNDEEFEKRLGSIVRTGATTIIIDNAKNKNRNPRIESACLERSITDPILSFRLLGHSMDIRVENAHFFCITANAPEVSRDLITRSVVVNLHYEGNPKRRTFTIADPEGYALEHRSALLGELLYMVERWRASGMPHVDVPSRFNKRGWGRIIGGILHIHEEPDFLANADEADADLDETRRDFADLIHVMADHPQGIWTTTQLTDLCHQRSLLTDILGEGSKRSQSTRLGVLASRYVQERFDLEDGRTVTFHRSKDRNGAVYSVSVDPQVRNVGPAAERLRNVEDS